MRTCSFIMTKELSNADGLVHQRGQRREKQKKIGSYCDASCQPPLCKRLQRCMWKAAASNGAIVCLLTPHQKVSPIYHNLTFSDSIQVSQGPKRECFKGVRRPEKREISSRLVTAKEKRLRFFLYVVVCKVFHLTSDSVHHRMPKGTECEIITLRGMLTPPRPPDPHPDSPSIIAFQACVGKEPGAAFCLARAQSTGDTLKSKTTPHSGPIWPDLQLSSSSRQIVLIMREGIRKEKEPI